jgi:membrane protease YdiL (CAAX protease family)
LKSQNSEGALPAEPRLTAPRVLGAAILAGLIVSLFPIYSYSVFSNEAYALMYDVSFAVGIRLMLAGDRSIWKRLKKTALSSVGISILLVAILSLITNYLGPKKQYEEGAGVSALVLTVYVALPVILLSCLMALVPPSKGPLRRGETRR